MAQVTPREIDAEAMTRSRDDMDRKQVARQKMLDAVARVTEGHVGTYNNFGQYLGACSCGLECNAVELIDHIDDIIGKASR